MSSVFLPREKHVLSLLIYVTINDPKFSDRQVWANSVDPNQTTGAV